MSLSQATLIQRVRNLLDDDYWETTQTGSYTAGGTTVGVPDGGRWEEGNIGEWQDTGEQFRVISVSVNTLTIKGGHRGTTPANHSAGVVILHSPDFTYASIVDAISLTIQSLWPYVWKVGSTTVTPALPTLWYTLSTSAIDLVRVTQQYSSSPARFGVYGARDTGKPVSFGRTVPTAMGIGAQALGFPQGFFDNTNTIYVDYRAKLTDTIATNNYSDLSDGILAEIVAFGAAARLMLPKEASRVSAEDANQGDSSVAPGARMSVTDYLHRKFVELRNNYHEELMVTSGPMKTWRV